MGRMVTQMIDGISVPADATLDIWSVIAANPHPLKLHGFELTSSAVAEAMVALTLRRITAAGTGGSASTTEELLDDRIYTAVDGTFRTLDTTKGADGGGLMGFQWEQLGPVGHIFTPETRPVADITTGFALSLGTALAFTASGFVLWEEL